MNTILLQQTSLLVIMFLTFHAQSNTACNSLWFQAASNNDIVTVKKLIKGGINIDTELGGNPYSGGETALMIAAKNGALDVMCELIASGADVNKIAGYEQPHAGKPVLRYAIDGNSIEAVKLLLQANAKVNVYTEDGFPDESLRCIRTHPAVRNIPILSSAIKQNKIDIAKLLIKHGADVNKESMFGGWTPLMIASYSGNVQAVKILLKAGAHKNAKNSLYTRKKTALDYAKECKHQEIIRLLS